MTDTEPEVRDPAGLLAAYDKLKDELRQATAERDELKTKLDEFSPDAFKARALNAETRIALQAQGIKDVDRLMPYIDTDSLDFDENGAVVGLDERMSQLKKDLPEVFDAKRRAGGKADIHASGDAPVQSDPLRDAVHNALNKRA